MKILITLNNLDKFSGSGTYTYTLAKELNKKHRVTVFSLRVGKLAKILQKEGVRIINDLKPISQESFDIIHAQHWWETLLAFSFFPNTPMVFLKHGVLPWQETPPSFLKNILYYVAVSEEVKENLIQTGINEKQIKIIRNPIDIQRFKPTSPINKQLKNVLVISNNYSPLVKPSVKSVILEVCKKLNLKPRFLGRPYEKTAWKTEKYINKSDLVISLGRGALESMSCGRAVIVYDLWGGDGIITKENFKQIQKNNFSGRRFKKQYTPQDLIKEIKKYDPKMAEINRSLILENFDVQNIAKEFVDLYKRYANFRF